MKRWEYIAWAGVLIVCLVAGAGLGRWAAPQPLIGVIRFDAVIDLNTSALLVDLLEKARQEPRIAAVVLEISSPGGLATSSESIFYTMLRLRAEKPLMVVVDGQALSGGYYMAAAGSRIYAPASSYIGNIGTRGSRPSDPSLNPDEMSSGPYKLSGGSRFDRIYQLDLVAEAFINNVMAQRLNSPVNPLRLDKRTIQEARIYLGSEAVAVGLVDAEGGRSDAILGASELAGLRRYGVADLLDYFKFSMVGTTEYTAAVKSMVETAPPDAVFLLDSRLALPGVQENSAVLDHMLRLREAAPSHISAGDVLPSAPESVPAQPVTGEGS